MPFSISDDSFLFNDFFGVTMKILFLTNVPSPYRVDFFNEFGKYCDLTVLFEKTTSDERDSSWKNYKFENFTGVFLRGVSVSTDTAICFEVNKYVSKGDFDYIICSNFMSPTGILAIMKMKCKKVSYFLEADGGIAKDGKGFKERLKKKVISNAAGYFSSSDVCDNYFIAYGADKEKLHRYPFTSLSDKDVLTTPLSAAEKKDLRRKLDLKEDHIVISVGRFSYLNGYGKGYDTLFKVCEKLPENIGVYVIGDEPTEEFVKWRETKNLKCLHFVPFKLKDELFEYYRAADISVLLSRGEAWGLVINESMANGTPVIATDACVGALELINHKNNGYIVPVDSVEKAYECITDFFSSNDCQNVLSHNAIETIKNYTIENMANTHIRVLKELLNVDN